MVALMISGLVGEAQTNLALRKTVNASGNYKDQVAANAVDGNSSTTWNSGGFPMQWIRVELGGSFMVSKVKVKANVQPNQQVNFNVIVFFSNGKYKIENWTGNWIKGEWFACPLGQSYSNVIAVKLEVTKSTSWVALYELEVY